MVFMFERPQLGAFSGRGVEVYSPGCQSELACDCLGTWAPEGRFTFAYHRAKKIRNSAVVNTCALPRESRVGNKLRDVSHGKAGKSSKGQPGTRRGEGWLGPEGWGCRQGRNGLADSAWGLSWSLRVGFGKRGTLWSISSSM